MMVEAFVIYNLCRHSSDENNAAEHVKLTGKAVLYFIFVYA